MLLFTNKKIKNIEYTYKIQSLISIPTLINL